MNVPTVLLDIPQSFQMNLNLAHMALNVYIDLAITISSSDGLIFTLEVGKLYAFDYVRVFAEDDLYESQECGNIWYKKGYSAKVSNQKRIASILLFALDQCCRCCLDGAFII